MAACSRSSGIVPSRSRSVMSRLASRGAEAFQFPVPFLSYQVVHLSVGSPASTVQHGLLKASSGVKIVGITATVFPSSFGYGISASPIMVIRDKG